MSIPNTTGIQLSALRSPRGVFYRLLVRYASIFITERGVSASTVLVDDRVMFSV